jgi:hypothetical protein
MVTIAAVVTIASAVTIARALSIATRWKLMKHGWKFSNDAGIFIAKWLLNVKIKDVFGISFYGLRMESHCHRVRVVDLELNCWFPSALVNFLPPAGVPQVIWLPKLRKKKKKIWSSRQIHFKSSCSFLTVWSIEKKTHIQCAFSQLLLAGSMSWQIFSVIVRTPESGLVHFRTNSRSWKLRLDMMLR